MVEYGSASQMRWVGSHEEIQHKIVVDGREVLCRATREYLEDRYGSLKDHSACLDAAQLHFDEITDAWGLLLVAGRFEPDGSILLRTGGGGTESDQRQAP